MVLDNISPRQILLFTALTIIAAILFTNPFSLALDGVTNLDNCQFSSTGTDYTINNCNLDRHFNDGRRIALAVEDDRISRFDMNTQRNWFVKWFDSYLEGEGYPADQYEIQCTVDLPFDDTSRDLDFCTNNQELADQFLNSELGVEEKTIDDVDNFQYNNVVRTDNLPEQFTSSVISQSSCTVTWEMRNSGEEYFETIEVEGEVYIGRKSGVTGTIGCLSDVPTGVFEDRPNEDYYEGTPVDVEFAFDTDFTTPTPEPEPGNGDDGTNGDVTLIDQVVIFLQNLASAVTGVFQ